MHVTPGTDADVDQPERCSVCGKALARQWQVVAEDDGQLFFGWVATDPYAIAETSIGEVNVCGDCYPARAERFFAPEDIAEVHHQFGLGFSLQSSVGGDERGPALLAKAKVCQLRALALRRKADYIAALAALAGSGEESDRLNREALELDPGCLAARLNLRDIFPPPCPECE
jgi:hypothetical protein